MDLYFPYLDKRLDFSYSLIIGGLGDIGVLKPWTVLEVDPVFADPENEDYRLKIRKPAMASPEIKFYPNPSSGLLYIQVQDAMMDGPFLIHITDLQGNIQQASSYEKLPDELNLQKFGVGTYLISIYNSDGLICSRKVIRE